MTLSMTRENMPIGASVSRTVSCFTVLFEKVPEINLRKGDTLFTDRGSHHHIWLVTKGMVKLYSFHDGREMLEDYYQSGELLNSGVLFGNKQDGLAAEAISQPTVVKKIPVDVFRQAMRTSAALCEEVLANVSASLSRTQERLRRITLLGSQQRVVHFLSNHVLSVGRKVGYEWVVQPALTHREMSYIAGTGRQTVTTVLNELRSNGIIHFNRDYLIVRDMEALQKLSTIA